jgi:hypothetical protein
VSGHLNGKIRTVYHPKGDDDVGLLQDFVTFSIEDRWGISGSEITDEGYRGTFSATIS